jgi:hypothetical protein
MSPIPGPAIGYEGKDVHILAPSQNECLLVTTR